MQKKHTKLHFRILVNIRKKTRTLTQFFLSNSFIHARADGGYSRINQLRKSHVRVNVLFLKTNLKHVTS